MTLAIARCTTYFFSSRSPARANRPPPPPARPPKRGSKIIRRAMAARPARPRCHFQAEAPPREARCARAAKAQASTMSMPDDVAAPVALAGRGRRSCQAKCRSFRCQDESRTTARLLHGLGRCRMSSIEKVRWLRARHDDGVARRAKLSPCSYFRFGVSCEQSESSWRRRWSVVGLAADFAPIRLHVLKAQASISLKIF